MTMRIKGYYTIKELNEILQKARMSPKLRRAIEDIKDAKERGDRESVTDLSAVKSLIVGVLDPKDKHHHFQEDDKFNEEVLGTTLYDYLDGLNYEYASATGTLPSGMMAFTDKGVRQRGGSTRKYPIIKLMEAERNAIYKNKKR